MGKKLTGLLAALSLLIGLCSVGLTTLAMNQTAGDSPALGWKADVSKADEWFTNDNGTGQGSLAELAEANRAARVGKAGDCGFRMSLNPAANKASGCTYKPLGVKITVDLDETPYLHLKVSDVQEFYAMKINDYPNFGGSAENPDTTLIADQNTAIETVIDLREKLGWSGEKTFWLSYFVNDTDYSGGAVLVDYLYIDENAEKPTTPTEPESPKGWEADVSKTDEWFTNDNNNGRGSLKELAEDARAARVEKVGDNGFRMSLDPTLNKASGYTYKPLGIKITVNLDETPYLHFKTSGVNEIYAIKINDHPDFGGTPEKEDTLLIADRDTPFETVIDLREELGWSGEKTFWLSYFVNDVDYSGGANTVDYLYLSSSKNADNPKTGDTQMPLLLSLTLLSLGSAAAAFSILMRKKKASF